MFIVRFYGCFDPVGVLMRPLVQQLRTFYGYFAFANAINIKHGSHKGMSGNAEPLKC